MIDQYYPRTSSARIAATAQLDAPGRRLQQGDWEGIGGPTVVGAGCDIGHFCVVGQGVTLGAGTILDAYCLVEGGVTIGENALLTHRASVGCRAAIGADSVIGALVCEGSVVGRECRVFGDLVHRQLDPSLPWDAPEARERAPILEDGVFIGWGATVVGGVRIGGGAYVCAGATVTKNVPPGWIVTGVNEMSSPERWKGALRKSPFFGSGRGPGSRGLKPLARSVAFVKRRAWTSATPGQRRVGGSPSSSAAWAAAGS